MGWRTVDILTIAFLGAALGVAFWGWGVFYNGPVTALKIGYAPLMGLFVGPWFLAGVVGGLVVRRPGAALFCEVVAALVSMLPGTEWGATVLVSGILQGLGAELAFALLGYRVFGLGAAMLAGVLSAPLEWVFEVVKFPASWADVPVLRVLADPTRLAVVERLVAGPASVSELAAPFDMAGPSFLKHLKVLEEAGVIATEKKGRVRTVRLAPETLGWVETWLRRHRRMWERRLDDLGAFLNEETD